MPMEDGRRSRSSRLIIQALPAATTAAYTETSPPLFVIQALPAQSPADAITPFPAPPSPLLRTCDVNRRHGHSKHCEGTLALSALATAIAHEGRRTRSQAAPGWTVHETLVLISEVAALDEDWLRALSSFQRWKMIAENCADAGVPRSAGQCRRRWESLIAGYRSIAAWHHFAHRSRSYWTLTPGEKTSRALPPAFDHDVFDAMDAVIGSQENARISRSGKASDLHHYNTELILSTDTERETSCTSQKDLIKAKDAFTEGGSGDLDANKDEENHYDIESGEDNGSKEKLAEVHDKHLVLGPKDFADAPGRRMHDTDDKDSDLLKKPRAGNGRVPVKAMEMSKKLEASAEKIHAILRGKCTDDGDAIMDTTRSNGSEQELVRRQADALIRTFGDLAVTLRQYVDLIKDPMPRV